MVENGTYQGQHSLSKQLVSVVSIHGQVTTYPLARAKLILSKGPAVHLTLLLHPHDRLPSRYGFTEMSVMGGPMGKTVNKDNHPFPAQLASY